MKNMHLKLVIPFLLMFIILAANLPACRQVEAADNYTAIVPETLNPGKPATLTISLLKEGRPARDNIEVALLKEGKRIAGTRQTVNGTGTVSIDVPQNLVEGSYEVQVKGTNFADQARVNVVNEYLIFVETDKTIYKPGQTIMMRVFTLDSELKPVSQSAVVEVLDAKGIKVFRKDITTDDYGMTNIEMPISSEPNLGVWKINVIAEKSKQQLDIRVEEYVLPKYEIKVELPREWFLINEAIKGKITAEYSFGKPVSGELTIEALKYVGQWQTYATINKPIDGETEFELPPAVYVAGTPAGGGQGNVQLNVTVREKSTGYEEKTSRLFTVAESSFNLKLIPEGQVFKPGLPFSFLVVAETPDHKPVDAQIDAKVTYSNSGFDVIKTEEDTLQTVKGIAFFRINPPPDAIALSIEAFELTPISSRPPAQASMMLQSSYSPSGNFIHLQQLTEGTITTGTRVAFRVYSTREASNFYYEVIGRSGILFSGYTAKNEISFDATPLMAPSARLLVYQILPNSEVAADYLPFNVEATYPQDVIAQFNKDEVKPGDEVQLNLTTEGKSRIGIAAVDKSVYILAENRLNLQQVFAELERLYMEPQAEIHEVSFYPVTKSVGAADVFKNAGVVVMTSHKIPAGKEYQVRESGSFLDKVARFFGVRDMMKRELALEAGKALPPAPSTAAPNSAGNLAEVERVRQFFPETWLWIDGMTSDKGTFSQKVVVPDSITTWMLRAVAISKEKGLGIAESSLRVFQPFFLTVDLPYSAIRGEEFPVQVAIYNYLNASQTVQVDIEKGDWYDLLDEPTRVVEIAPNDIGGVSFMIRPTRTGVKEIKITARSSQAADAAIKTIIVEPEGVPREIVENLPLSAGNRKIIDTSFPINLINDSARAYIALTSSFLTQTIDGLDALLQMPFGCGEQNMIVFAPDVYITKYLKASGQVKPEIMAKAEKLMITGYQRELTYRRTDGSFSAFGMNDQSGSLWLTAFVLKSFSQAKDLIYVDEGVLKAAAGWIVSHQNNDGSFDQVGFVHHQEMLGGLKGKDALTAYVAIALKEAGENESSNRAITYLEGKLDSMSDPYTVALTAYALELAKSPKAANACEKLISLAREDENGMYWGSEIVEPQPLEKQEMMPRFSPVIDRSATIETTAYATLALIKHGDDFRASRSARWLVSKRNAYGGFGSTQDTVVALQALTEHATNRRSDVNLTVTLKGEGIEKVCRIDQTNFDVLQIIEIPVNSRVEMSVTGTGEAIGQIVRKFNEPAVDNAPAAQMLKIDVDYDTAEVEVSDLVKVNVSLKFDPLPELGISEAGMIVLDISVPTGFEAVKDSIAAVIRNNARIKRYDIAGRKVIFYVENMKPGETLNFSFQVKALYPVKAKGVTSTAYSYYKPDIRGEVLSVPLTVK
jgi:CD109 antigen